MRDLPRHVRTSITACAAIACIAATVTCFPARAVESAPPDAAVAPNADYLVLLETAAEADYRAAAERLARLRGGEVLIFDRANMDDTFEQLRARSPKWVVFVMRPADIDIEFTHDLLERATALDDDLFVDFEYGFITGRDGPAAEAFVSRIEAAQLRRFENKGMWFGSWEGAMLPVGQPMSVTAAMGFDFDRRYVLMNDSAEKQQAASRAALADMKGKDLLMFMSHGYADRMVGCFTAKALKEWNVDLNPAVLISCACFNGAPGRWWEPGMNGFMDRGVVMPEESVALALIDSGVSAFIGGVDPWHGPLAMCVFNSVADDGMRLGEATKSMFDRLALEFAPDRIAYGPVAERGPIREGTENRRSNAAGMILHGDPAWAPFAHNEKRPVSTSAEVDDTGTSGRIVIEMSPLVQGAPGADFMLAQARVLDYFSIKSHNIVQEAVLEVCGNVAWDGTWPDDPELKVVAARVGETDLPCGTVQSLVEQTHDSKCLHIRIPTTARAYGSTWTMAIAQSGLRIELAWTGRNAHDPAR